MKKEAPDKIESVFKFFKNLFPNYSTDYWLLDNITLSYALAVDSDIIS